MRDVFFDLASRLTGGLRGGEVLFCNLDGEDSDFARLNQNRIRQAGSVRRIGLDLHLISGRRHAEGGCTLSGEQERDLVAAGALLQRLRQRLLHVAEDPYLDYSANPSASERIVGGDLPDPAAALGELTARSRGLDLVGIWASGDVYRGLASSLGHRHWHQSTSFNLDWSCYLEQDKAVKARYGGCDWNCGPLLGKLESMRHGLEVMARPARSIAPGRYRAHLAPEAVRALLDLLAWGGFGIKDHRTSQTPLLRLVRNERRLDSRVTLAEDHARGLGPGFTSAGFRKPERVVLIAGGQYRDCLVAARSGKEYGLAVNAGAEYPESLALEGGDIQRSRVLERLGTGLYIGNLWYLNYADRNDCRITGMTRFGTYWVEDGELVDPVDVMRFDDTLYDLLGRRLEGLTMDRELILSAETYGGRSTASHLLPGILVSGIELTL